MADDPRNLIWNSARVLRRLLAAMEHNVPDHILTDPDPEGGMAMDDATGMIDRLGPYLGVVVEDE